MAYSTDHLRTAGKVTVYTTFVSLIVLLLVFAFNFGSRQNEVLVVDAQSNATTTVIVLNTPPLWVASTTEEFESSSDNPTNAGSEVSWVGTGYDTNSEDYYLLICSTATAPTTTFGGGPPSCVGGIQWAVSTATISGTQARAATTTLASWAEVNNWFSWICDNNATTSRCNTTYTQGTNATNSSPFEVNHRPSFTAFSNDSPGVPGSTIVFTSTSADSDVSGVPDTVRLFVCATPGFDTVGDTCTGTTLASTTVGVQNNATTSYYIVIPTQDRNYGAYGYVIDNHGFEATAGSQGSNATITVSNVAPTVASSTISINGGLDMTLSVEAGLTTGFSLQFVTTDNNSCVNAASSSEVIGYELSLYRSGIGQVNCEADDVHNPNNCYPSGVAPTIWNLTCTASSTSCAGPTDTDQVWDCNFPLWFLADPTDGVATSTQYWDQFWFAQVRAYDDNNATGTYTESAIGVKVKSFLAFALNTLSIPYGALEPGDETDFLVATTTISATGNVGLDKDVQGSSMCTTYSGATPCAPSDTSTIPEDQQRFATSQVAYLSGTQLSSTTPQEVEINVPKTTATSTYATSNAYWGIRIPATITLAGDYTGENTFTALVGESAQW